MALWAEVKSRLHLINETAIRDKHRLPKKGLEFPLRVEWARSQMDSRAIISYAIGHLSLQPSDQPDELDISIIGDQLSKLIALQKIAQNPNIRTKYKAAAQIEELIEASLNQHWYTQSTLEERRRLGSLGSQGYLKQAEGLAKKLLGFFPNLKPNIPNDFDLRTTMPVEFHMLRLVRLQQ